jgi:hypothetical protein
LLCAEREKFVSTCVAVTVAFGTTEPVASVMVPRIDDDDACAMRVGAARAAKAKANRNGVGKLRCRDTLRSEHVFMVGPLLVH